MTANPARDDAIVLWTTTALTTQQIAERVRRSRRTVEAYVQGRPRPTATHTGPGPLAAGVVPGAPVRFVDLDDRAQDEAVAALREELLASGDPAIDRALGTELYDAVHDAGLGNLRAGVAWYPTEGSDQRGLEAEGTLPATQLRDAVDGSRLLPPLPAADRVGGADVTVRALAGTPEVVVVVDWLDDLDDPMTYDPDEGRFRARTAAETADLPHRRVLRADYEARLREHLAATVEDLDAQMRARHLDLYSYDALAARLTDDDAVYDPSGRLLG